MLVVSQVHKALRGARGKAEAVIRDPRTNRIFQKRLAFCSTDKMGRFSFDLPVGENEFRACKSEGFEVTSVLIKKRKYA